MSIDNIIIIFLLLSEMYLNLDIDFYTHTLRIHAYQLHCFELLTNHAIFFMRSTPWLKATKAYILVKPSLGRPTRTQLDKITRKLDSIEDIKFFLLIYIFLDCTIWVMSFSLIHTIMKNHKHLKTCTMYWQFLKNWFLTPFLILFL